MRIKATISEELTNFYATFQEECNSFEFSTSDIVVLYNGDLQVYEGPYSVTPKTSSQTLATAQRALMEDVEVYAIPYSEVTNNSGGITATIGG